MSNTAVKTGVKRRSRSTTLSRAACWISASAVDNRLRSLPPTVFGVCAASGNEPNEVGNKTPKTNRMNRALRRGMKNCIATIRHHTFRLEQLPFSFAVLLARIRRSCNRDRSRGGFAAGLRLHDGAHFQCLTLLRHRTTKACWRRSARAFSLGGGPTNAYHAFAGRGFFFPSVRLGGSAALHDGLASR